MWDNHTLYFKIGGKLRKCPSLLKQEKWMGVATVYTLKMGDTCARGGHPVSKTNTVYYGIVQYSIV